MTVSLTHPKSMYVLAGAAALHNFAFWGVVTLFPFFMTRAFGLADVEATQAYGVFFGAALALPLVGGLLAASFGRYSRTVLIGCMAVAIGCLALSSKNPIILITGLTLVALGYGMFWPPILVIQGKLYDNRGHLRSQGFTLFYALSSTGVLATQLVSEVLLGSIGWNGFYLTLSGVAVLAMVTLLLGRPYYKESDLVRKEISSDDARVRLSDLPSIDRRRVLAIIILAGFTVPFWIGCSQMGSSVLFFSNHFVHRSILNIEVPVTVFVSFFALSIVVLGPIMAMLWGYLDQRNFQFSAPKQMAFSMLLLALSFLVLSSAAIGLALDGTKGHVNPSYLFAFYFLQACAVIIMGPVGLAFVTKWAPRGWTGRLTGVWFSATGLGGFMGGYANKVIADILNPLYQYGLFFLFLVCVSISLFAINRFIIKMLSH